jgi:hypothetical protein
MSKKFTVIAKLQNFSGDAAGNLYGTYALYPVTTVAGVESINVSSQAPGAMGGTITNISVNTHLVDGENPIHTLDAAFSARADLGTVTESTL